MANSLRNTLDNILADVDAQVVHVVMEPYDIRVYVTLFLRRYKIVRHKAREVDYKNVKDMFGWEEKQVIPKIRIGKNGQVVDLVESYIYKIEEADYKGQGISTQKVVLHPTRIVVDVKEQGANISKEEAKARMGLEGMDIAENKLD